MIGCSDTAADLPAIDAFVASVAQINVSPSAYRRHRSLMMTGLVQQCMTLIEAETSEETQKTP